MESTLADVKQLFNVKTIASAKALDALVDGEIAFVEEGSTTSLSATTAYADLPEKVYIVSKMNGKIYHSFTSISKDKIRNVVAKEYVAETTNTWRAKIENCKCIKDVQMIVNIDEQSLQMRDGLTWTHREIVVAVPSEELNCACDAFGGEVDKVLENNIMTKMLVEQTNFIDSEFFTAEAQKEDGTVITDWDTFIAENNKEAGEDPATDPAGPKEMIYIVLKGKSMPAKDYKDLDVNYVFPRGVQLKPALKVDGKVPTMMGVEGQSSPIAFEEVQKFKYEIGAGADLRAEEFENMNHYTKLNYHPNFYDGIANPELVYQFENGVKYHTLTLEYFADNTEANDGRSRLFGILFGTSVKANLDKLKAMFGAK